MKADTEWRAKSDAFRAIAKDIPDPKAFADQMLLVHAEMLISASFRAGSYFVYCADLYRLRRMGLVEFGGNCLTAFGIAVRRALVADNA